MSPRPELEPIVVHCPECGATFTIPTLELQREAAPEVAHDSENGTSARSPAGEPGWRKQDFTKNQK